jgi:hypothetical protein
VELGLYGAQITQHNLIITTACERYRILSEATTLDLIIYPFSYHAHITTCTEARTVHNQPLTSGHQVRADQHPDVPRAEAAYHVFALGGAALGVHDVHVDAVVDQLLVQLL